MKDRFGTLAPQQRAEVEQLISRNFAMFLYLPDRCETPRAPESRCVNLDSWFLQNPDGQYPQWEGYLKKHQPKILVEWDKNDPIFLPPGAEAYKRDAPKTEIHFYNTGHFALEEESTDIAKQIKTFYR
jgi:pimeloyl-ACP methyl ester carboxylesterase